METCDHEPCTQPTTTTTTNTSAFNDTSRHIGDKNLIQQVLVGLSSSFPINYTCYHYTAVGKYCTLCVQTVEWCQMAWGTMETRFIYFLIVKWTLHSACFTSTAMIQIYILGARLMSFKKWNMFQCHIWNNSPIRLSKRLLKSPSGEGNHSLPGLIWVVRHNLIGWFFVIRDFIGWHRVPGQITRYSLRVLSHLTMYSWQSVHLCYKW